MNEKLYLLISDVLKIPVGNITEEMVFKNAETWDSLRHMELIGAMEQLFGIEFSFDEIISIQSIQDIIRIIKSKSEVC